MSESIVAEILAGVDAAVGARVEALVLEMRRQGRACIAAQAASEACADSVVALRDDLLVHQAPPSSQDDEIRAETIVRALLPVADAVERVRKQAHEVAKAPPRRRSLLARLTEPPAAAANQALSALVEGLDVLAAQLEEAFRSVEVTVDRCEGVPVDGNVHRVVEVRRPPSSKLDGTVAEVIRPGYRFAGKLLREADVVAFAGRDEGSSANR